MKGHRGRETSDFGRGGLPDPQLNNDPTGARLWGFGTSKAHVMEQIRTRHSAESPTAGTSASRRQAWAGHDSRHHLWERGVQNPLRRTDGSPDA